MFEKTIFVKIREHPGSTCLKPALDKAEVKVGNLQNKIISFNNSSLFGFESPKGEASIYQGFN